MDYEILFVNLTEDENINNLFDTWSFLTTDINPNCQGIIFVSYSKDLLGVLQSEALETPCIYLLLDRTPYSFFRVDRSSEIPFIVCPLTAWRANQKSIQEFSKEFFNKMNKSALSGLQIKLPRCPDLSTERSVLPPLLSKEGITDFPTKGENKKISFKNSQFKMFPFKKAIDLALTHPKAWCSGGNHFGNKAFNYWIQTMSALEKKQPIPIDCQRWIKKREGYIARHTKDFRLAGVVAMIKWAGFVDGPNGEGNGAVDGSSLRYMTDLFKDED